MLEKLFLDHPRSVGESYGEHFGVAMRFSGKLLLAAGACFIHGLAPFLFKKTGSKAIAELHDCMVTNRVRRPSRPVGAVHDAA